MRRRRSIAALAAALLGVGLLIASHGYDWSEGTTFFVGCALAAFLGFFGPLYVFRSKGGSSGE